LVLLLAKGFRQVNATVKFKIIERLASLLYNNCNTNVEIVRHGLFGERQRLHRTSVAVFPTHCNAFRVYIGRFILELENFGEGAGTLKSRPKLLEVDAQCRFNSDAEIFRLASEAHRLNSAYLFEPYLAVRASLIEPLPHQISAVY